ncbi:MAG: general stress protein [Actinobacteria bacterium]|nr:general stress protein [Actinomycetota bacterium]
MPEQPPQMRPENQPVTVATYTSEADARQAVEDLRAEGHTEVDIVEVGDTQYEVTITGGNPPDAQDDLTPSVTPPPGE